MMNQYLVNSVAILVLIGVLLLILFKGAELGQHDALPEKTQDKYVAGVFFFLIGTGLIGYQRSGFETVEVNARDASLRYALGLGLICSFVLIFLFIKWKRCKRDLWTPILLFILWPIVVFPNIELLNGVLDIGPSKTMSCSILSKRRRSSRKSLVTYECSLVCGTKRYSISVDESTFRRADVGDSIEVVTSPGAFGLERMKSYRFDGL